MFESWFPQDKTTLRKLLWFRTAWEKAGPAPTPSDPLNTFVGSIVRFLSNRALPVVKLEANFTPIQNLNGQDAPYPPGGGKNLFDPDSTGHEWVNTNNVIAEQSQAKSVRIPTTAGQTYSLSVKETVSGNVIEICFLDSQDNVLRRWATSISTVRVLNNVTAPENTTTLLASISTWATVSEVQLESGSTATTFAPYANECPITGHTGCDVVRDGKNLLPNILTQDNESLVVLGSTKSTLSSVYDLFLKAGSYTLSFKRTDGKSYAVYYRSQIDQSNISLAPSSSTEESFSFTLPHDDNYIFWIYKPTASGGVSPTDISKVQLELGSTASDYEAFQGTTVAISFGNTVYGCQLTVFEDGSGQVVADRAYKAFSDLTGWQYRSNQFDVSIADGKPQSEAEKPSAFITDTYETKLSGTSGSYPNDTCAWQGASANQVLLLHVRELSFTSVSDFLAARGNAHICYELATPVTIPLTAEQISTLPGVNNVWVNAATGDITVQAYGTEIV